MEKTKNEEEGLQETSPISALGTAKGGLSVKVKMFSETLQEWIDVSVRDEKMVTQLNMMLKREENIPKFVRVFREVGLIENKE